MASYQNSSIATTTIFNIALQGSTRCIISVMVSLINARSTSDRVVAFLDLVDTSESEEEDEANIDLASLFVGASMLKHQRCAPIIRERLNWERHVCLLNREGQFTRMYRMSYTSYCKL